MNVVTSVDYGTSIPNNVNLADDRRVLKALEKWHPGYIDWWMTMVILGGAGTFFGPLFGTAVFLLLEELLSSLTIHWHLIFGILLILSVLFMKGGISGLIGQKDSNDG